MIGFSKFSFSSALIFTLLFCVASSLHAADTNQDGLDEIAIQQDNVIRFLDSSGAEISRLIIPESTNMSDVTRVFPVVINSGPGALLIREKINESSTDTNITIIANDAAVGVLNLGRTDKSLYSFADIDGSGTFDTVKVNILSGVVQVYYDDFGLSTASVNSSTTKIKAIHTVVSYDGSAQLLSITGSAGKKKKGKKKKKKGASANKIINLQNGNISTIAASSGFTAEIFGIPGTANAIERKIQRKNTSITTLDLNTGLKSRYKDTSQSSVFVPGVYISGASDAQGVLTSNSSVQIVDLKSGTLLGEFSVPNLSSGTGAGSGSGSGSAGNPIGGGSSGGGSGTGDTAALELLAQLNKAAKDFSSGKTSALQFASILSIVIPQLEALMNSGTVSDSTQKAINNGIQNLGGVFRTKRALEAEVLPAPILRPRRILNPDGSPGICTTVTKGERGFLWKPVGEKDGQAVALSNAFTPGTKIYNDKGKSVMTLKYTGASNGRLFTLRAPKTPPMKFWMVDAQTGRCLRIPNRNKRYER